jgi:hypothetical protein
VLGGIHLAGSLITVDDCACFFFIRGRGCRVISRCAFGALQSRVLVGACAYACVSMYLSINQSITYQKSL